ncbi:MAG: DciA family protein [Acidimicrobiales bacterium]
MTWQPLVPPPSSRDPRPVAASLGRVSERLGLGRPELLTAVFARWEELVGPDVAAHATPRMLRDGVLTVTVDHPAWAASLRLLAGDLLARVAGLGGDPVRELVVQVAGPSRGRRSAG